MWGEGEREREIQEAGDWGFLSWDGQLQLLQRLRSFQHSSRTLRVSLIPNWCVLERERKKIWRWKWWRRRSTDRPTDRPTGWENIINSKSKWPRKTLKLISPLSASPGHWGGSGTVGWGFYFGKGMGQPSSRWPKRKVHFSETILEL